MIMSSRNVVFFFQQRWKERRRLSSVKSTHKQLQSKQNHLMSLDVLMIPEVRWQPPVCKAKMYALKESDSIII